MAALALVKVERLRDLLTWGCVSVMIALSFRTTWLLGGVEWAGREALEK